MLNTKKPSTSKKASVFFNFFKGDNLSRCHLSLNPLLSSLLSLNFDKGYFIEDLSFIFLLGLIDNLVGITFTRLRIYEENRNFPIVSGGENTCSLTQAIDFSSSLIVLPFLYGFYCFFFLMNVS